MAEVEWLVSFVRQLRVAGLRPGAAAAEDFCRATALLGIKEVYWAGRATLVSHRDEIPVYDRVFHGFLVAGPPSETRPQTPSTRVTTVAGDDVREENEREVRGTASASRMELLRQKSFERCTDAELVEIASLAGRFVGSLPRRRSRRRAEARTGTLDLRSTLRRSLRTEGEPLELRFRGRPLLPRRLALLIDVSGSMTGTSRGLLVLAHSLVRMHSRMDVYCFGTRITRVTAELSTQHVDAALAGVGHRVTDWEGGTRIGESLKAFLDGSGHRGVARGATVVICSDGLEVGDPDLLAQQMRRLSLLAHRVVWLNPLKASADYEPIAQGMQAALPFIDIFGDGSSLASVEDVVQRLAEQQFSGRSTNTRNAF